MIPSISQWGGKEAGISSKNHKFRWDMHNALPPCRRQRGVPGIFAENAAEYVLHGRTNVSELKPDHKVY